MISFFSVKDVVFGVRGWWRSKRNREAIERHLKDEYRKDGDRERRSMAHLQRHLRLTEDEIWKAVRGFDKIKVTSQSDNRGRAVGHWFEIRR